MHRGYLKLFRKVRDNPRLKDPHYLALWIWLLVEANHSDRDEMLGGKRITCRPGQFTKGRKQLAELSGINESKVERLLSLMESEQQIEQRKTTANRLITISNWNEYQESEQRNEQQVNNDRTTSEQRVNTLEALNHINTQEDLKAPAEPILIKDQKPTDVDLKDVKLFDFSEGAKHKLYNQMIRIFSVRGWRTDPEFIKTVFKKVCGSTNGIKPTQPYPYFQKTLANYLNQHSEEISTASRKMK